MRKLAMAFPPAPAHLWAGEHHRLLLPAANPAVALAVDETVAQP